MQEFPHDVDAVDYSTLELIRTYTPSLKDINTTPSTYTYNVSDGEGKNISDDVGGGRQVVERVRVRRDAFDHLDAQHVDELWRAAADLVERSAVTDAKRRQARRRRDLDYWQRLMTLLEQLDELDQAAVGSGTVRIVAGEGPGEGV